jgi:hypothetical protein
MKKFKELFVNSFFYCLAIELVEEVLEELISLGVANVITFVVTKIFSAFIVFFGTQVIKLVIKKLIKKITYKEGNDKVEKLKKILAWVRANKCTLLGVGTGVVTAISGAGLIDVNALPPMLIGTFNLTPVLYYALLGVATIICSFFPETVEKFKARIEQKKAEKQTKTIENEAKKEIAKEEKLANQTQAEQEKAKAKEEAEKVAKAEKEKADAEHRAKVEEVKKKLLAEAKSKETQNA